MPDQVEQRMGDKLLDPILDLKSNSISAQKTSHTQDAKSACIPRQDWFQECRQIQTFDQLFDVSRKESPSKMEDGKLEIPSYNIEAYYKEAETAKNQLQMYKA